LRPAEVVGPTGQPKDLERDLAGRLWLAATTGARYLAVDINEPALAAVTRRAAALGLTNRVSTAPGSFEQLPASSASVDAVTSIEAFMFVSDKPSAAAEVARVLRPGGRLVMVSYDYSQEMTPGRPPQLRDHRPLLTSVGLDVVAYDETPQWREQLRGVLQFVAVRLEERARELDMDPEQVRGDLDLARQGAELMTRRVLIVAERT
jgi:ubiquinone/menaquinone biosynthesis C-methylase UbiE